MLASWAVPQGPDARPQGPPAGRPRRGPPHRVLRLRGRHPQGRVRRRRRDRVGLGDVAAGPHRRRRRGRRHRPGRAPLRPPRREAGRALRARPPTRQDKGRGKEQWLLLHKNDEHAQPGWDPEDHPRSVKTGRTNDEVAAAPDACGTATGPRPRPPSSWAAAPPAHVGPADRRGAGRPRRPGQGRDLGAPGPGAEAHQPRQGAVPGPGRRGARHQAGPHPLPRPGRPVHAALPVRPAGQPEPVPRRGRQARLLAQGGARATPPTG